MTAVNGTLLSDFGDFFNVPIAPTLYPSVLEENGALSNFSRKYFSGKNENNLRFSLDMIYKLEII
jgi:hypothetical protein